MPFVDRFMLGGPSIVDNTPEPSPRPECAVCARPVEDFEIYRDPVRMMSTMIARCHGEEESVEVEDERLVDAHRVGFGKAFAAKAPALPEGTR